MSIVALMNLEGLEGSYRAMLDEAIKVPLRSRIDYCLRCLPQHRRLLLPVPARRCWE
jgi:hypothetical protein